MTPDKLTLFLLLIATSINPSPTGLLPYLMGGDVYCRAMKNPSNRIRMWDFLLYNCVTGLCFCFYQKPYKSKGENVCTIINL